MRIVEIDEFMTMPTGTIYNIYEPDVAFDLAMKGESLSNQSWASLALLPLNCGLSSYHIIWKNSKDFEINTEYLDDWGRSSHDGKSSYIVYADKDFEFIKMIAAIVKREKAKDKP